MVHKHLISPSKLRKLPGQFSWIDQRLVRNRHIDRLSHPACALYLFLLMVADAQGLSFYSDCSLGHRLSMSHNVLHEARQELVQHDLVAYQQPLYQVLALDAHFCLDIPKGPAMASDGQPVAIKDIFKHIAETLS
jgi:hypothetical protein